MHCNVLQRKFSHYKSWHESTENKTAVKISQFIITPFLSVISVFTLQHFVLFLNVPKKISNLAVFSELQNNVAFVMSIQKSCIQSIAVYQLLLFCLCILTVHIELLVYKKKHFYEKISPTQKLMKLMSWFTGKLLSTI